MESGAASLSSQFRTLAQDFRGTDPAGGYQRVIDLAAYGGKLCRKAHNAGLLDLTRYKRLVALLAERASKNTCQQDDFVSWIRDLLVEEYGKIPDEPLDALNKLLDQRLDERKTWPSRDSADMWAGTWMSIVSDLSRDHPDELPCNLFVTTNSYDWAFRGRFRGEALRNAKTEWRSLAQNYAMVADWLAEHLQAGDPAGDLPGALAAGSANAGAAGQANRRRKRKRQSLTHKPLTPRQAEVTHIVGECKGDIAAAARRLSLDRKTVAQHYEAAMKKLGKAAVKHATQPFRTDRRGQADLTAEDDRRR